MKPKHSKLLVAIDLGNTRATIAVFDGLTVRQHRGLSLVDIPSYLHKNMTKWRDGSYITAIICDVVPEKGLILKNRLSRIKGISRVLRVGSGFKLPLRSKYKRGQAGRDRLVNAYGALEFYGGPCLVIDYGTAINFDFVSKSGVFEGGLIIPGVRSSILGLGKNAPSLPGLDLSKSGNAPIIGRSTKVAMRAGILRGFAALSDGLIGQYRKKYGRRLPVVVTGGDAGMISRYMTEKVKLDPLHTVRSLACAYHHQFKEQ